MTVTWEHALTECETRLDAALAALEGGSPADIAPFSPPEIDGPLPAPLADRARACCARGEELDARLANELERVRRELRRLPRMPRAQRDSRFDAQA